LRAEEFLFRGTHVTALDVANSGSRNTAPCAQEQAGNASVSSFLLDFLGGHFDLEENSPSGVNFGTSVAAPESLPAFALLLSLIYSSRFQV
jgi:hypothetical protein